MQSYQNYKSEFNRCLADTGETGYVIAVTPPLIHAEGIPGVKYNEIVYFESGEMGQVLSMNENYCEVLVLSIQPVQVGTRLTRSGTAFNFPATDSLRGKTVNSLGFDVNTGIMLQSDEFMPLESIAPGIESRVKISEPFETGVSVVDMMIPLGKGQRELVIGDRQTGKTEFLLQTLLTQAKKGTLCVYANVGKKKSDIKRVEDFILRNEISHNVILMVSSSTEPLGLIYLTPYAAMTVAEYFVRRGQDVMVILDDLSIHAKFFREISLLAKRFPGRNSYPGDIFYSHSRLLERAGNFMTEYGTHSITCLVAAETIQGDISGYIQTSLMSITDGHIFFDNELFEQGRRPAVNYFLSVTRVGRQTQSKIRWGVNRELASFLTLYEKTQRFIHFGAEINEGIKSTLNMGSNLLSFFDQPMGISIDIDLQIFLFSLIWLGAVTVDGPTKIQFFREKGATLYNINPAFKKKVSDLIQQSPDFNVLLGKIGSQSKAIMEELIRE